MLTADQERKTPSYRPVQRLDGWIAPVDLYAAINRLAEQNPAAKHVCWDMLMLAHELPRHLPTAEGEKG